MLSSQYLVLPQNATLKISSCPNTWFNFTWSFGHALKSMACLTASRNKGVCRCEPAERCLYRQLFDPPKKVLKYQDRIQDIAPPL